jgi:hypothetical protein
MVDGALLQPVNVIGPPWAPAELPSVKQLGSWCAEVDEDVLASCEGVADDLDVIGDDDGNLAFNTNGATGADLEESAPSEIGIEIPFPAWKEGWKSCCMVEEDLLWLGFLRLREW